MREAALIARIRELFPRAGDDAAVVGDQVLTNDMLVEGVDFTTAIPLRLIARKAIAVNVSDLAAMGGEPEVALVAVGAPQWVDVATLVEELAAAAAEHAIEIVGGDLSSAEKLVISVTAIGRTSQPLLRSGARAGDRIYVSRPLGGSAAGLHLLGRGWSHEGFAPPEQSLHFTQRDLAAAAIRAHLDPLPEVTLGIALRGIASSCIDISDGLSTDLHNLCEASGVGAEVERMRIPVFSGLVSDGPSLGIDVANAVLHGGEEYALIFTSRMRESELSARVGRPVYAIGRITAERGVLLDGKPFEAKGWDHFA